MFTKTIGLTVGALGIAAVLAGGATIYQVDAHSDDPPVAYTVSDDDQCFYQPSAGTRDIWDRYGIRSCETEAVDMMHQPWGEDLIGNP